MKPAEVLRAARAKIEKPENWCQGTYAQDGPCGTAYCAEGALFAMHVENEDVERMVYETLLRAAEEFPAPMCDSGQLPPSARVIDVNDTADHATVLAMFDRAISLAEQEDGKS